MVADDELMTGFGSHTEEYPSHLGGRPEPLEPQRREVPRSSGGPRWRRLARGFGTTLVSLNLLWLTSLGLYGSFSQGILPWPGAQMEQEGTVQMPESFNSEASSMAVVRDAISGSQEEPPIVWATGPALTPDTRYLPPTRISIPSIGLDSPVVEIGIKEVKGEMVWETAAFAVGHHKGSANPGQVGNIVMSGHISSPIKKEGSVFKRLPELKLGETVVLQTEAQEYRYRVVERRVVEPSQVDVMASSAEPKLTLITCYPDWIYSHRLVVTAKPESPTSSGERRYE